MVGWLVLILWSGGDPGYNIYRRRKGETGGRDRKGKKARRQDKAREKRKKCEANGAKQ